jgi:hypothetical protein
MSGAMMGGNGSPTSNLFPSITSLFQSPIGTPRVTPTPQHFAAYLFNEDQFHSLIFPSNSDQAFLDAVLSNTNNILSSQQNNNNNNNNNSNSSANMIANFTSNESNSNFSPIFNNLLSNSLNNLSNNNTSHSSTNQATNETLLNEAKQKQNSNNLLSAKD